MRQKSGPEKQPAEDAIRDIRRATRRHFSAEEKIRVVLEGLRGEERIAELCRREGIASSMYYGWSKEFLEAGKRRPAGDTTRAGVVTPRWACGPAFGRITEQMKKISYARYRFPPEIIHQAIWLYLRFSLSLRDVEDLLAERGLAVSYETVRRWVNHFGPMIAADLRKRRQKPHTTWHLDEVYLKIDGRMVYLWRAVDAEGEVLDVLVQSKQKQARGPQTDAQALEEVCLRS